VIESLGSRLNPLTYSSEVVSVVDATQPVGTVLTGTAAVGLTVVDGELIVDGPVDHAPPTPNKCS
jgi:hypothetical protein